MLLEKTSPTISSDFSGKDLRIGVIKQKPCVKHTAIISQEPVLLQAPENNSLMQGIAQGIPPSTLVVSEGVSLPKAKEKPREKGNRCGHDPKNLKVFQKPPNHGLRYYVIEEIRRRICQAFGDPFLYPLFYAVLFHLAKNGKNPRKKRSERREAEYLLVLLALIHSVNLVTMQAGYYNGLQFIHYDYAYLVKLTGLRYCRVVRAMKYLKADGLVEVQKVVKTLNDGAKKTERVIMTLSTDIFTFFELADEFAQDRARAIFKHREKEKKAGKKRARFASYGQKALPSEKKRQVAAVESVKGFATHFKINQPLQEARPQGTLSDEAVRSLTHTLFLSGNYPTLMLAAIEACRRLDKPPPINSS